MILLALASLLPMVLLPWLPDDISPPRAAETLPPVVLVAETVETPAAHGFDVATASRRVIEGAIARLRAAGAVVRQERTGRFMVAAGPSARIGPHGTGAPDGGNASASQAVTLTVGFGADANWYASGSETRFGGEGDASWRLASRVQRHVVGGLRDVMGYRSYDRGVLEVDRENQTGFEPPDGREGAPWVALYPLFASNPAERALLEWPETLELLSAALADAVAGYLDPSVRTVPRDHQWGWRKSAPWQPVSPRAIYRAEGGTRVALTFDGGASSAPTPAILKALREAGVRATMFMTADFVEKNPELVVEMARDGHEFGNHSSTHPDMTTLSTPAIVAELERLEAAVVALTGKSTRPWFRPPFGASNDRLMRVAAEQGYYTVMWTADSADWRPETPPATVARRLLAYASPGAILIQHLGSPQSAQVMPEVLRGLREREVTVGTLSEVVGTLD